MPFQTAKGFFNNGGFAMTIDTWHYTKIEVFHWVSCEFGHIY